MVKPKKKLSKEINNFLKESYYPLSKRPVVRTGATLNSKPTLFQLANQQHAQGLYDDFPVAPIDATIQTAKKARQVFDKVTYPL